MNELAGFEDVQHLVALYLRQLYVRQYHPSTISRRARVILARTARRRSLRFSLPPCSLVSTHGAGGALAGRSSSESVSGHPAISGAGRVMNDIVQL